MSAFKDKEELLQSLGVKEEGEASAYEFNDRMYADIA